MYTNYYISNGRYYDIRMQSRYCFDIKNDTRRFHQICFLFFILLFHFCNDNRYLLRKHIRFEELFSDLHEILEFHGVQFKIHWYKDFL